MQKSPGQDFYQKRIRCGNTVALPGRQKYCPKFFEVFRNVKKGKPYRTFDFNFLPFRAPVWSRSKSLTKQPDGVF